MIEKLRCVEGGGTNPYENLALEKALLDGVEAGELIVYLWQNRRTVVVGRNQNLYQECRVSRLLADGGFPARRLSGGGAVFHDLGNLNFTFVARDADYDVDRQLSVIRNACAALGVRVEKTGRNDLTADGKKFSGNAFHASGGRRFHHGTIMVDVDGEALGRYLNVDREKLARKGVASVRARVCNLAELVPGLTVEAVRGAMWEALERVYGLSAAPAAPSPVPEAQTSFFASDAWLYGRLGSFSMRLRRRFSWGELDMQVDAACGRIRDGLVYSDAMDEDYIRRISDLLPGAMLEAGELAALAENLARTSAQKAMAADIRAFLYDAL